MAGRYEDSSFQETPAAPAQGVSGTGSHVVAAWDPSAGLDTAGRLSLTVMARRRSDGAVFLASLCLHYVRRAGAVTLHTAQSLAVPLLTGALAGLTGLDVDLTAVGTEIRVRLVIGILVPGEFDVSTFLEARGFTV